MGRDIDCIIFGRDQEDLRQNLLPYKEGGAFSPGKMASSTVGSKVLNGIGLHICARRSVQINLCKRNLHVTSSCYKVQSGRYKITPKGDKPLTYEMANPPHYIAHRKSWNSWNTSSLEGGLREPETAVEDIFIRRFMTGTWHSLFASEVIIKRQHNMIRVAGLIRQAIGTRKMYFLIGYCEEMLSYWLQCPVKLELQVIGDPKEAVFKYI